MTRLDAIKAALRGLDPNSFVEDMAWLLAQVEALAGALRLIAAAMATGGGWSPSSSYMRSIARDVQDVAREALAALETSDDSS